MKNSLIIIMLSVISFNFYAQSLDEQLLDACYNNNEKEVYNLIQLRADVNTVSKSGVTPLMYAVQNGNYTLCQKLLDKGANPNYCSLYNPPALLNAVINNDTAITFLLLENKANPNAIDSNARKTALLHSIENNNALITDLLLYYGANVNKQADTIPIFYAIEQNADTSVFNILLKYKAKVNIYNGEGFTPLIECVFYNNLSTAKLLLAYGAKPRIVSKNELKSPLYYAMKYHLKEMTTLLSPYYTDQAAMYHQQAILNDFSFAAKQIRKSSGKKFIMPFFTNVFIGDGFLFTYDDWFYNFSAGIHESRYNLDITVGVEPRLTRKRVLLKQSDNTYLQLWEHRTILKAGFVKYFPLKYTDYAVSGLFFEANADFSYGSYDGSNLLITKKIVPDINAGWWWRSDWFRFSIGCQYLPIETKFPFFVKSDIQFLFNLIPKQQNANK